MKGIKSMKCIKNATVGLSIRNEYRQMCSMFLKKCWHERVATEHFLVINGKEISISEESAMAIATAFIEEA